MVLGRALGKTPYSQSASHDPGVEMYTGGLNVGDETDIPLKRVRNTPSLFILQEPDKLRPNNPLGSYADFTFTLPCSLSTAACALKMAVMDFLHSVNFR